MGGGPPGFRQGFSCPALLGIPSVPFRISRTGLSPSLGQLSRSFRYPTRSRTRSLNPNEQARWFSLFRFRSPLLTESLLFSLPVGTEMFHFPTFAPTDYVFIRRYPGITQDGLPHSEIPGSKRACRSPRLIAAYHVLLRLPMPRHSPSALTSLTKLLVYSYR